MWTVTRIEEADFGCEERLPGEPLMVLVTIECDDGRVCQFECAEKWLLIQGIDEGEEWPEDIDEANEKLDDFNQMTEWMENYYDAMSELE